MSKQGNEKMGYLRSQGCAVIAILLGLLLLIHPDFGTATVGIVVGGGLTALGALILVVCFLSFPILGIVEILAGIASCAVGITLIRTPDLLGKLLGYVIAGALLLRGLQGLGEANRLKKLGYAAKWNLILAVVMIIAAVILFAVPLASSRLLMRLVGAAVVLLGLLNVGLQARFEKLIRASDKKIVDADL